MTDLAVFGVSMLLTMARVSGLIVATPIFSSSNLPAVFKVGLILSFSFCCIPLGDASFALDLALVGFAVLLAKELLVGIVLGLLVSLFRRFSDRRAAARHAHRLRNG